MLTGGFIGKILKVDLTSGRVREEKLDDRFHKMWLGGYGLGARILYDEIPPRTDPLGPDNMLGFTTGILTGAFTPLGSSLTVVGKSPLTGTWGDSRAGGYFGAELKFAGFDAVFFHGRSAEPAYLWVNDGRTELRRASHLWGKDVTETEDALREENRDSRVQVVSIGPAGEERSLISGVVTDKGRVAARSGLGAVMGSKNLKAIAVRGSGRTPVADSERLMELRKRFIDLAKEEREFYWDYFGKYGTSGATAMLSASGDSPCARALLT